MSSLSDLHDGGLYVNLYVREPEVDPDNFHWALYFHHNEVFGGTKYNVKQQGPGWIAEHGVTKGALKSLFVVGLFRIANVPSEMEERTKALICQEDGKLNDIPGITCKVWLLRGLERLQANGILKCGDLVALEEEVKGWGNGHQQSAIDAEKP